MEYRITEYLMAEEIVEKAEQKAWTDSNLAILSRLEFSE